MVSEMEPRYQSSKTAMLQTFICHLPNTEYSFILPVKFSLGASLPAQNSSRLPGLHSSHQGHPLAGTQFRNYLCLCPGLSGALRWQALPKHASHLQMLGLLLPSPNNRWTWNIWRNLRGTIADLPLASENSLLVSRGLPQGTVSAYLAGWFGWHLLRCHSQYKKLDPEFSLKAGTSKVETEAPSIHTPMSFNVCGLILTMFYHQIHKIGVILFP